MTEQPTSLQTTEPAHIETPAYHRITHEVAGKILRLRDEGLTVTQIADIIGVNHSSIVRCLHKYTDTSDLALKRLKAKAHAAADRTIALVETGKDEVALAAAKVVLGASGVIGDSKGDSAPQTFIQIGIVGAPQVTAQGPRVQVAVGNHNAHYQTQKESASLTAQALTASVSEQNEAKGGGESR